MILSLDAITDDFLLIQACMATLQRTVSKQPLSSTPIPILQTPVMSLTDPYITDGSIPYRKYPQVQSSTFVLQSINAQPHAAHLTLRWLRYTKWRRTPLLSLDGVCLFQILPAK
ncbi:hypothetical protein CDAR_319451 [Caerostris darwini]|uniref:Uncharacterized protein n=1 Tax=Caerostris darwini TaxID=1538125 RepID=A0AAV4V9D0_9ARAC|nr:hypothetical protein CDAR_319451 [Caerostris darwini]